LKGSVLAGDELDSGFNFTLMMKRLRFED